MTVKNPDVVMGRPTLYTPELGKRICDVVATHPQGLKHLCAKFDWMPDHVTIHRWRWELSEFCNLFTKAKISQAELYAEDCIDIADDTAQDITYNKQGDEVCNTEFVNRSRLRVDTRKWMASKLLPKLYGDPEKQAKLEDENATLKEEMISLRAELDAKNKKEY